MNDLGRRRLFLAVALDPATRGVLAAHLEAHGLASWPGRVVRPENWHITLRFLGWTTDVQRDRILRDLDEAELPAAFRIRFAGLGAFPKPRRAAVTWIGVRSGVEQMEMIAAVCEEAAQAADFSPEERPYHPHVTLSRVRPPVDVTDRIERFPVFDVAMDVTAITLFESHLSRGGATYEAVDTVELRP